MAQNYEYDPINDIVIAYFDGFMKTGEFKEIALKSIALRQEKGTPNQLAFIENMKVLSQEIQEWIKGTWFPTAIEGGLKKLAFVVPRSFLAKFSMKNANEDFEGSDLIAIEYFASKKEAINWLNLNK